MELGKFSVSLSVKNIETSKVFYEKLGFEVFGGEQSQNWLIMKNGDTVIGLFQDMFDSNILTFNPGWDNDGNTLETYEDIRDIYKTLKSQGVKVENESLGGDSGPGSFSVVDPDGNAILIDQHV